MKPNDIIAQTNEVLGGQPDILAALLIGSYGRKQARLHSDIDYQIWVGADFCPDKLCEALRQQLNACVYAYYIDRKQMVVCYFEGLPKVEIACASQKEDLARFFLGSEIYCVEDSLVFDRTAEVREYLASILAQKEERAKEGKVDELKDIASRFIYNFEKASASHRRNDEYRSYFYYNTALHCAIQLHYYASGHYQYLFLPPKFSAIYENDSKSFQDYLELTGSLDLSHIDGKKRKLLDYFYKAIDILPLYDSAERQSVKALLESFYRRDYLWNFRDSGKLQPKLRKGKLFRASSLTASQSLAFFKDFIQASGINKVIDLRHDEELSKRPYHPDTLSLFQHIHLPIDPRKQSEEFQAKYHYGTKHQIAYRHFAKEHKGCFKRLFEEVDPEKDVFLIHCHAGKDRTGSIVALLSLLVGSRWEDVVADYEASELDSRVEKLQAFLEVVEEYGGIEPYLHACDISQEKIDHWKKHLSHV